MSPAPQSGVSAERPFPGLRPFGYRDHPYFFGRKDQTYALYRLIDHFRFIAVVGSSGSGKSSLVRAGLLPLLDIETQEEGGRAWVWREMRPGDAPLQRLTNLLATLSDDDDPIVASGRRERITAHLQRSSFGIAESVAEANGIGDKSLVLVIDQFEELFRFSALAPGKFVPNSDEVRAREEARQFVQLLLQASRGASRIRILLTMRSDFIGDCARFHELPEAVSAAQFLVPSLTRDQLEEVIREPIDKAGATINAELVQRLLNDCGAEMDQLPVLQHCLSRLWDEAGKTPAETTEMPVEAPADGGENSSGKAVRDLALNHYRNIGGFADALSWHADEVLKDLPGDALQLAVQQCFSALSELDKEGRAIRRALRFSQLLAETGVAESDLRRVIERFRSDDCSFLVPTSLDVPEIEGSTRIDVGHEALLRSWEKVSGSGAELGWLRSEQQSGERYRVLLAMTEDRNATLPPHLVAERLAWWNERPRTETWAERYGGGFTRVKRTLHWSQRLRHIKRLTVATAFVVVLGTAGAMFWLWHSAVEARKSAERTRLVALNTTEKSISRLPKFLNAGALSTESADSLLVDAREMLKHLAESEDRSPQISKTEISLLHVVSDVYDALGRYPEALTLAKQADESSQRLIVKYPTDPEFKQLSYASKFRIGDQHSKNRSYAAAETEYRDALETIQHLASNDPKKAGYQHQISFIRNKLGDLHEIRSEWQDALNEFNIGLRIAQIIAEEFPGDIATQKNRIALVLSQRGLQGDDVAALDEYREALDIQVRLLDKKPGDAELLSNIALTHRRIGGLLRSKPDEALREYLAAVEGRKTLYERDPGNVAWRQALVLDYTFVGDVWMQKENWRAAAQNYNAAIRVGEGLVLKSPDNASWLRSYSVANLKRGDALIRRGMEPAAQQSSRPFEDVLARYQTAEKGFEQLIDNPQATRNRFLDLFDARIKVADVLARQGNHKDALAAYRKASSVVDPNASVDRTVDWHKRLAASLENSGDLAMQPQQVQLASIDDGLAYYRAALEAIEAASARQPDRGDLRTRKSAISDKIGKLKTPP